MQTLDFVSGLHNCQDSPNPSSLDIMLCKHRKKVFYCFYKITFPREKNSLFRLLIKREVAKSCTAYQFLFCNKDAFQTRVFLG